MTNLYYGQNAEFSLVSRSHGRFELGYCESMEIEPQHTQKKLYFFNKKEGLPVSILEGASGRFGYLESEELHILGVLMNINTRTKTVIVDEPAAYQEFHVILNAKSDTGVLDLGILAKRCRAAGNPASMTPRDEQHGSFGYQAATRYVVKGAGIAYDRILSATPDASLTQLDSDLHFVDGTAGPPATSASVTLSHTPELINIEAVTTTRYYFYVLKNGSEVKTGFTIDPVTNKFELSPGVNPATDVWEVFYAYKTV